MLLPSIGEIIRKRELPTQSIECLRNGCTGPMEDQNFIEKGRVSTEDKNRCFIRMQKNGTSEKFASSNISDSTSFSVMPYLFY